MLKFPTIIVLLLFLPSDMLVNIFRCSNVEHVYQLFYLLDELTPYYIMTFFSCYYFGLLSILSDISIATPTFLRFPLVWNIFFHSFTLNICVSLKLKQGFYRQYICGSCFYHIQLLCAFELGNSIHRVI